MPETYTALASGGLIASGGADHVASAVQTHPGALIFADRTGERVEVDGRTGQLALRGPEAVVEPARGRGRPRLGVVAREVTLLPRHWDWLSAQPGGASAALRRLVEAARTGLAGADRAREARQAVYAVMHALAGDLAGFEAATRALFAGDDVSFDSVVAGWPEGIAAYVSRLAAAERQARASGAG